MRSDGILAHRLSAPWRRGVFRTLVVLVVGIGLFLRLWALGRQPINADEAVVGLMAREILHGHFSAFYWGQSYGGGEAYVVAALFFVFGQSGLVLGLTPVILDAVATVLIWRVGRRLFEPAVGVGAAVLFWVWPEVYVWQSTLEYGFRWATLSCGLTVVLLGARLADDASSSLPRRRLEWCGIGLASGLGWWCSPESAYFLLPVAVVLVGLIGLRRIRVQAWDILGAVLAAAVGALPWIWSNLHSHFASLKAAPQPFPSFSEHLNVLRLHALPIVLGLQLPVSGHWILGSVAGRVLEYLAVVVGIGFLVLLVARRQAIVLVVFAVVFPFAYAYSPFTWYWQDGRYTVYLAPVVSILLAAGAKEAAGWLSPRLQRFSRVAPLLPGVVVLLALALTLKSASDISPFRPNRVPQSAAATWTSWQIDPTGYLQGLAGHLEGLGAVDVIAGYWVAYPIAFESKGSIVASDIRYARYSPFLDEVEGTASTWLFVSPEDRARAAARVGSALLDPGCAVAGDRCLSPNELIAYLRAAHIAFTEQPVGDFVAINVARAVDPAVVLRRFGIMR